MKLSNFISSAICALSFCVSSMVLGAEGESRSKPPRAARSVHLGYPASDSKVFYKEMIVDKSTTGSYFMVCGWNTGYFGIQELSNHKKVILFSVWDSTTGDDPNATKLEDRVECLYQAPDVRIKRFGGEGTGGQCMADFNWELGETHRFAVSAKPEGVKTAYTGYVWQEVEKSWKKLVTFRTRTGGMALKGLYSFVEDFRRDGASVLAERSARFGEGWVRGMDDKWAPLTKARFTASSAEWEAKENIDAGLKGEWYYLATGGEVRMSIPLRTVIEKKSKIDEPKSLSLLPD